MEWYWIFLLVFLGFIILFLIIIFSIVCYFSNYSFKRNLSKRYDSEPYPLIDEEFYLNNKNKEKLTIKSYDNLNLVGYLYKNNSSHNYVIFVHGYRGHYYEQSYIASYLYKKGYNVLLVSNRGHDESEGKYIGVGALDKFDVFNWVNKIVELDNNSKIALFGWSMGGASVLMCSGLKNLVSNVKVVVSDCAFTNFYDEVKHLALTQVFKNHKILANLTSYLIYLYTKIFYKIDIKESSTLELLKNSKLPTLLIHGNVDYFVPKQFTYQNYDVLQGKKELKIFNAIKHCRSLADFPNEYVNLVYNFINENI